MWEDENGRLESDSCVNQKEPLERERRLSWRAGYDKYNFSPSWMLRAWRTKGLLILCTLTAASCLYRQNDCDLCRLMLCRGIPSVSEINMKAFLQLDSTFLFSAERVHQLLLLVQALQESSLLWVAALPEGLQLIPGLLMLPPQALFSSVALTHLLTQPAQLGLVGLINTNIVVVRLKTVEGIRPASLRPHHETLHLIHRLEHEKGFSGFSNIESCTPINAKDTEQEFN